VSPHQDSRIFVVDEEHNGASTLAAILQKSGFSARFFTCPREALAARPLHPRSLRSAGLRRCPDPQTDVRVP
jgi:DNA-binding NtrC family response regulator